MLFLNITKQLLHLAELFIFFFHFWEKGLIYFYHRLKYCFIVLLWWWNKGILLDGVVKLVERFICQMKDYSRWLNSK